MQERNWTNLDFSGRTDALAVKLGCDLGGLPAVLGFSKASLFAYRSGKARITGKAWRKLEAAELAAGIPRHPPAAPSPTVREDPADPPSSIEARLSAIEARQDQILKLLLNLTHNPEP